MRPSLSTATLCDDEPFDRGHRSSAAAEGRQFGGATVGADAVFRDGQALAGPPPYLLLIQLAGAARYATDDGELLLEEGDGLLTDGACMPAHCSADARCGTILLPRHLLRPPPAMPEGALRVGLSRRDGRGRLICDYARNVIAGASDHAFDGLDVAGESAIIRNLCNLLNLAIAATHAADAARESVAAARRDAIDAFLRENYADPALSPATVAARFGISVRYLDKLFQRGGQSFMATLIRHRLAACCAMLSQRQDGPLPIAEIARRAGFATLTQFNRQFRAAYGKTPRAWRATQSLLPPSAALTEWPRNVPFRE